MPYRPRILATPRVLIGSPRRASPHGHDSFSFRTSTSAVDVILSQFFAWKTSRAWVSSRTPLEAAGSSSPAPESVWAAMPALSGQTPLAASAIASNGRQQSEARSFNPFGMLGSAELSRSRLSATQRAAMERSRCNSGRCCRVKRSTCSCASLRRSVTTIERSCSVPGSVPYGASIWVRRAAAIGMGCGGR